MKSKTVLSKLDLLKSWVRALRSGKYSQGQNTLRFKDNKIDKFCCLGVACEIYSKKIEKLSCIKYTNGYYKYNTTDRYLPSKVARAFGLSTQQQKSLADLNDYSGLNFDEIADYVENNIISKVKKNEAKSTSK